MTERRSRGTRRSSNCFQTCSALGLLFFIFRSRRVESLKLKERQRLNTESTEAGAQRSQSRKQNPPTEQIHCRRRCELWCAPASAKWTCDDQDNKEKEPEKATTGRAQNDGDPARAGTV